jgi:hypothetical protein
LRVHAFLTRGIGLTILLLLLLLLLKAISHNRDRLRSAVAHPADLFVSSWTACADKDVTTVELLK